MFAAYHHHRCDEALTDPHCNCGKDAPPEMSWRKLKSQQFFHCADTMQCWLILQYKSNCHFASCSLKSLVLFQSLCNTHFSTDAWTQGILGRLRYLEHYMISIGKHDSLKTKHVSEMTRFSTIWTICKVQSQWNICRACLPLSGAASRFISRSCSQKSI